MKILYLGSSSRTSTSIFYADALETLGFEVHRFDPEYFSCSRLLEKALLKVRRRPAPHRIIQTSEQILALCKQHAFDAIFVMAENFFPLELMEEIRSFKKNGPLFLYHSHDNNFAPGILKPKNFFSTLAKFDFAFTTKSQNVARYKELGQAQSYFIPSAFEPRAHFPIDSNLSLFGKHQFDVSFVGTYDHSREKFLEAVGWDKLYVWGNGWKRSKNYSKYPDHIVPHAIYLDEFSDVISHSHISLGLLREEAQDLHTQRTFEIPACGALQISPRNSEILSFFDENKEIICFESLEELKEKAHYYLTHETERKKIAEAGLRRVNSDNHTYLDRVKTIFQIAGKESGRWRPLLETA